MDKKYVNSKRELNELYYTTNASILFNNSLMRNGKMKVFLTECKNGKSLYYECANGDDKEPCHKCRKACNAKYRGARKFRIGKFFEFLENHKSNIDSDD